MLGCSFPMEVVKFMSANSILGTKTTEIVPNDKNEMGLRHYMSAYFSSPSPPLQCTFGFHKTLVEISITHSAVTHLSEGLLYLQHSL